MALAYFISILLQLVLIDIEFYVRDLLNCILNCCMCRDLSRNYLNGSLPPEWGLSRLTNMYVVSALLISVSQSYVCGRNVLNDCIRTKGERKYMLECRISMTSFF